MILVKNNKLLLIGGVVLIVLLVGGLVLFSNKSATSSTAPTATQESVPTISADSIGLTLKPGSDSHRVVMDVSKTSDIQALDYELSYIAKGNIPRGALGHIDVKSGQKVHQEMYLGTCSDVCHPDSGVTGIKIIVKVTKTDGKIYQSEASTSL